MAILLWQCACVWLNESSIVYLLYTSNCSSLQMLLRPTHVYANTRKPMYRASKTTLALLGGQRSRLQHLREYGWDCVLEQGVAVFTMFLRRLYRAESVDKNVDTLYREKWRFRPCGTSEVHFPWDFFAVIVIYTYDTCSIKSGALINNN